MRITDFTSGAGPVENVVPLQPDRSIGALLMRAGKLKPEDADSIVALQKEKGLRFGEAAKALGLLTQADIDHALSRQFEYPYLRSGESKVSEDLVAAYDPFSSSTESMRALRTQLMLRWFDHPEHKALAVVSAARGEGRSYIAANLAVVFSQLGERTLLVDADLRHPTQHQLFGLDNRVGLSAVLSGRAGTEAIQRIPALLDLSVLPAGVLPPNPQELLARPAFGSLLKQLAGHFDVILLDSPPAGQAADTQAIVVRAGAALVVVKKNSSRTWKVRGVTDSVAQAKATIVGSVLNDF